MISETLIRALGVDYFVKSDYGTSIVQLLDRLQAAVQADFNMADDVSFNLNMTRNGMGVIHSYVLDVVFISEHVIPITGL